MNCVGHLRAMHTICLTFLHTEEATVSQSEAENFTAIACEMKTAGKPDAGNLHVRFDEGEQAKACSLLYCPSVDRKVFVLHNSCSLKSRLKCIAQKCINRR